jgi:hypothetical protein
MSTPRNADEAKLRRMTTLAAGSAITHASSHISSRNPVYLYSSLVAGMGSGAVSAVVCAPLDLVRTRLQVWGDVVHSNRQQAVITMFRDILRTDGIAGCFRGLTATLLTVPAFWGVYCECTIMYYEYITWCCAKQFPTRWRKYRRRD